MDKYRVQLALYPGGHPEHADGEESLAAYLHVLGEKDSAGDGSARMEILKIRIAVQNSNIEQTRAWTGSFQPSGRRDDNLGTHALLPLNELRNIKFGWIGEKDTLRVVISVTPGGGGKNPGSLIEREMQAQSIHGIRSTDSASGGLLTHTSSQ